MLLLNLNTIHQESFLDYHNEFRWLELKINEFINEFENVHGTKDHPNSNIQIQYSYKHEIFTNCLIYKSMNYNTRQMRLQCCFYTRDLSIRMGFEIQVF